MKLKLRLKSFRGNIIKIKEMYCLQKDKNRNGISAYNSYE
jgi:hypothetical protein